MKWVALALALSAIVPFSGWIRDHPAYAAKVWIVFGALPFLLGPLHLDMSLIDWAGWPGHTKGLQVSLLDILALSILFGQREVRTSLPFRVSAFLYLIAATASLFDANLVTPVVFYIWQLARMMLIYVVVARACSELSVALAITTGLAIGLCFQAGLATWQRFGLGMLQVGGGFGHQNSLGFASHFVIYPLFALLLAGDRRWSPIVGVGAGLVIAALTISRATLGLVVVGLALTFILSVFRDWSRRKTSVLFVGIAMVAIGTPFVISSFERRFAEQPLSEEYDERRAFEDAAAMMFIDRPLGVGANNFVTVANTNGYYDRAGVAAIGGSRSGMVHNAYYLAAAETGILGIMSVIMILSSATVVAFRTGWQARNDIRGDLLLGLAVAMFIVSVHAMFEWVLFLAPMQYLFAIDAGVIAGLVHQLARDGGAHPVPKSPSEVI